MAMTGRRSRRLGPSSRTPNRSGCRMRAVRQWGGSTSATTRRPPARAVTRRDRLTGAAARPGAHRLGASSTITMLQNLPPLRQPPHKAIERRSGSHAGAAPASASRVVSTPFGCQIVYTVARVPPPWTVIELDGATLARHRPFAAWSATTDGYADCMALSEPYVPPLDAKP
jgi:hypothetical protein